jgi:PAS domain-containing protein
MRQATTPAVAQHRTKEERSTAGKAKLNGAAATQKIENLGSQSFLAAIVDSTDDGIIGKSLDGIIVSWNTAAKRVYGHSAAEIIDHLLSAFRPR